MSTHITCITYLDCLLSTIITILWAANRIALHLIILSLSLTVSLSSLSLFLSQVSSPSVIIIIVIILVPYYRIILSSPLNFQAILAFR